MFVYGIRELQRAHIRRICAPSLNKVYVLVCVVLIKLYDNLLLYKY